jgi:hypothetical protein
MELQSEFDSEYYASIEDYSMVPPAVRCVAPGAGAREIHVSVFPRVADAWVGAFAAPDPGVKGALTALLGTPSKAGLLVVERGTGFYGQVGDPQSFGVLPLGRPFIGWRASPEHEVLALYSPWEVLVLDSHGVRWVSERLSFDGLLVEGIDAESVWGTADPGDFEPTFFRLDLHNGERTEGSFPFSG